MRFLQHFLYIAGEKRWKQQITDYHTNLQITIIFLWNRRCYVNFIIPIMKISSACLKTKIFVSNYRKSKETFLSIDHFCDFQIYNIQGSSFWKIFSLCCLFSSFAPPPFPEGGGVWAKASQGKRTRSGRVRLPLPQLGGGAESSRLVSRYASSFTLITKRRGILNSPNNNFSSHIFPPYFFH